MMTVVQKDFVGAGENFVRNQLVDSSQFGRIEQVLITQRFLRPATEDEISSARFEDEPTRPPLRLRKKKSGGLKIKVAKR